MNIQKDKQKQLKVEWFWTGFMVCGILETLLFIVVGILKVI